jgi:hypothetical protein
MFSEYRPEFFTSMGLIGASRMRNEDDVDMDAIDIHILSRSSSLVQILTWAFRALFIPLG